MRIFHTHTTTKAALLGVTPCFANFLFCVPTSAKVVKTRIKKCTAKDNEENEFSFAWLYAEI